VTRHRKGARLGCTASWTVGAGLGIGAQVLTGAAASQALVWERVIELLTGRGRPADPQARIVQETVLADLADAADQLARAQQQKEAAFAAGDIEAAAALRDREKQVLAGKQRLRRELSRLHDLLRQHGIEPDGGTARTA
jgi:hypothetical protein